MEQDVNSERALEIMEIIHSMLQGELKKKTGIEYRTNFPETDCTDKVSEHKLPNTEQ